MDLELRNKIVDYLVDVYGFEIAPISIPLDRFEYFKRDFYLRIKKINEKLFYFLRDKVFPIKFRTERVDNNIWLYYRDKTSGEIIREVEVYRMAFFNDSGYISWYITQSDIRTLAITDDIEIASVVDDFLSEDEIFIPVIRDKVINILLI